MFVRYLETAIILISLSSVYQCVESWRYFHRNPFIYRKYEDANISYQTKFYDQPVDHFGYANQDRYQMRYLVNDDHWDSQNSGPIFFYCGNEGDIELFSNNTGFMWEIAPEFKAMIVFAEHRYYGQSMPYGKDSYKDLVHLGYLSSEQALADFARLITYMKDTVNGATKSPVIAFGGSYGGMLATWFRMKYPNTVHASLAASAPIWMFPGMAPCNNFYKVVTADFEKSGPHCADNIKNSWTAIDKLGQTDEGRKQLDSIFNLCAPLNNTKDVGDFKGWFYGVYGNLAMVDYPYPANFLAPLPAWPIKEVCKPLNMKNPSDTELLAGLSKAVGVYYNYTGTSKCLDTGSQATSNLGDTGWDFQACSEMVMPICTDGKTDMFEPDPWNFTAFAAGCKERWGVTTRPDWAEIVYRGKDLRGVTNIIFSNGGLDPWSGGGVLMDLSPSLIAVFIEEGAHHLDLRSSNPADPIGVKNAREKEIELIARWIQDYKNIDAMDYSKYWADSEMTLSYYGRNGTGSHIDIITHHFYIPYPGILPFAILLGSVAIILVIVAKRKTIRHGYVVRNQPRWGFLPPKYSNGSIIMDDPTESHPLVGKT